MNWLPTSRMSFRRRGTSNSPPKDCDPFACFESFKRHWQQAYDIINRTEAINGGPSPDDVLGVVNNLEQLMSLLLIELRNPASCDEQHCLEHLLSQGVLEKLLVWSRVTSRYNNLRLEQLKLYEMLLSNASQRQLLIHEPFLRPLLALLNLCGNEYLTSDTEKRLILLLNQLCVCLMKNPSLLDLFFTPEDGPRRFIIFGLLIPYMHREGGVGQQARDAMLLCMTLSKKNEALGNYIAVHSNVCPVLATGLSGLYSRLPRKLAIETEDWHCFTPDDVNEMPELTLFLNSLEFCNAVVQVAYPSIQSQMLEFIYHGFLVPVMGPALLQSVTEELVATTAYLDLFLRSITEPGLLQTFLRFLFCNHYDGERVIDKMIQRLGSKLRLGLVSLSLFNTLISFNCEDVMLELVFQYLIPCTHVMLSQRKRIKDIDFYCKSAEKFLSLSPSCFSHLQAVRSRSYSTSSEMSPSMHKRTESLQGDYCAYLFDAHKKIETCTTACLKWVYPYDGISPEQLPKSCNASGAFAVDSNRNFTSKSTEPQSLGESSGYESFACKEGSRGSSPDAKSDFNGETSLKHDTKETVPNTTESSMQRSTSKDSSYMDMFHTTPDVGPFLEIILQQLDNMMNNGLYLNLQLTGLISRLATFPQPLLSSFLLNTSLVFQPSNRFRSLFQVLGSLKQRIDTKISQFDNIEEHLIEAQSFLIEREERIVNARRLAQENSTYVGNTSPVSPNASSSGSSRRGSTPEPFNRSEPRRRSFSSTLTSVFRRAAQGAFMPVRENAIEYSPNGYRYTRRVDDSELRQIVMCAVILDEWLKELAALSQEHVALSGMSNPLKS